MPGFRFERGVRWLAGTSFGLYLLHYPLLNFFGTVIPGPPDGAVHRLLVFALALGAALALARLAEPRKKALKRGGGQAMAMLDEGELVAGGRPVAFDDLDQALCDLARLSDRQARVVELRFFGGLTTEETGHVLGISPATVKRDWALARAWLYRELSGMDPHEAGAG